MIRRGLPPTDEKLIAYRTALFDLWMPGVSDATEDYVAVSASSLRQYRRYRTIRFFLNGHIQNPDVVEFYTLDQNASPDCLVPYLKQQLIPALLPKKIPLLPRGKWTGHHETLAFFGLLDGHHCLLAPLVQVWTGRSLAPGPEVSTLDDDGGGWADFVPANAAASLQEASDVPEDGNAQGVLAGDPGDDVARGEMEGESESGYVEFNRKMRADFFTWSTKNDVCVVVAMIALGIRDLSKLIHRQIAMSGKMWSREQRVKASQGLPNTYRALEASGMENLTEFYRTLRSSFHSFPAAVHAKGFCRQMQVLLFRVLCSAGAAVHYYVRTVWRGLPLQLFQGLKGAADAVYQYPKCFRDALSRKYMEIYKDPDAMRTSSGQASLHALASVYTLDILGIEARPGFPPWLESAPNDLMTSGLA